MATYKNFTCAELTRRLRREYPSGEVFKGYRSRYCVTFDGNKVYTYNCESLYSLALRLGLATPQEVQEMKGLGPA